MPPLETMPVATLPSPLCHQRDMYVAPPRAAAGCALPARAQCWSGFPVAHSPLGAPTCFSLLLRPWP